MVWYGYGTVTLRHMVRQGTIWYSMVRLRYGMEWYCMVWHATLCYGMVLCGTARCVAVRCVAVRCGAVMVQYSIVLLHLTLQANVSVASYYNCFNNYDCSNLTVKTKPKINNSSKIKTKNTIMIIIKYTNIEFRSCFLRFYFLWWCARRMPLAKNSSWELVYHISIHYLSVHGNSSLLK